jgi:3-deoxy-D-manno-octulosonic-acid transferase
MPSYKIKTRNYMLFHASSFGEAKTLMGIVGIFEQHLNKKAIFSLFTDTGYKLMKEKEAFIMPIDLYPLYSRIFSSMPSLAMFFETEIWPSYIAFLKNRGVKLALINARMSDKSFRFYKIFSFLFKKVIGMFDIIIAKSEEDAQKFKLFNKSVIVCGNIKQIKQPQKISDSQKKSIRNSFSIETSKPILTFGSVHKEEIDFVKKAVGKLKDYFFIVVAPRHKEYADQYFSAISDIAKTAKRSQNMKTSTTLILDTMGELEDIYKISDVVFIGGSTKKTLKGHNPIEPLVYNKFIICGPYMESFKNEVETLLKENLITVINNVDDLLQQIMQYTKNTQKVNSRLYFNKFSDTLDCYVNQLKIYEK